MTNKGAAKEALRHHQKARSAAGSELISLKELEDRAGRTKEQQKAYQKSKKRGGRANDAQRANNNAQNNNNNVL